MIQENQVLVMDIDGTLCVNDRTVSYNELAPNDVVLDKLKEYKAKGFYVILYTSRNMRTHEGNIGRINAQTAKILLNWLDRYEVPYDEIHYGKPWCGRRGFYVDDKAIRPDEFAVLTYEEIQDILYGH